MGFWNGRKLLLDYVNISLIGDYPEVFVWTKASETVYSKLDETFSTTEYVNELLGVFGGAERPKATADAACHDNNMMVGI